VASFGLVFVEFSDSVETVLKCDFVKLCLCLS
jgi:hypothetical protein